MKSIPSKIEHSIFYYAAVLFYVLCALWSFDPYFSWNTFWNGALNSVAGVHFSTVFGVLAILFSMLYLRTIRVNRAQQKLIFGLVVVAVILFGICGFQVSTLLTGLWMVCLMFCLYIIMPNEMQRDIFQGFYTLFSVLMICPILIYVLDLVGVNLSFDQIESTEYMKAAQGVYYKHYPLTIAAYYPNDALHYQMVGIFSEPGLLGTLCGLFLSANGFRLKNNWKNIIIFVAGCLTLSLAFILIVLAYFVVINIMNKKVKNVLILMLLPIAYILFMTIPFENAQLSALQNRMEITTLLFENKRTNAPFERLFDNFLHNDLVGVVLGKGHGYIENKITEVNTGLSNVYDTNNRLNVSSWKMLLYDYGILGIGAFFLWIVSVSRYTYKRVDDQEAKLVVIALTTMFIINQYQRPSTFHAGYLLILLGGLFTCVENCNRGNAK